MEKHENSGLKPLKDSKTLIEYSSKLQGVYINVEEEAGRKCHVIW